MGKVLQAKCHGPAVGWNSLHEWEAQRYACAPTVCDKLIGDRRWCSHRVERKHIFKVNAYVQECWSSHDTQTKGSNAISFLIHSLRPDTANAMCRYKDVYFHTYAVANHTVSHCVDQN